LGSRPKAALRHLAEICPIPDISDAAIGSFDHRRDGVH
jgi:hypothetical protein